MADFDLQIEPGDASDEGSERDPDPADMFSAPAAATAAPAAYQVLARKYRPRTFEDLIGQEAMVRTLTNAFAADRIAHGFMLTGVRGVGKTTTARLLARAFNYESETVRRPSVALAAEGRHCREIMEGRHIDVLELDAASHTGVDNIRDLLDSVRYGPVSARNKVYVIDEVHMLSKSAFNALLKTLEEPPPHAKFILATTEIRRVPVTILSRTQRFDLRRVEPEVLIAHLERVCAAEGVSVDADGLALIARAAEGSVRDALSLLDQAIVQAERGETVPAEVVRNMLGLADAGRTLDLFEAAMRGATAEALAGFRALYALGADPGQVAGDLLEHAHGASIAKMLGEGALGLPRDQAARLGAVSAAASAGSLSRMWQMLLKAHGEVRAAPDPAAALEMALIRLCYAADLPGPEEALRRLQDGRASVSTSPASPAPPSGGGMRAQAGGGASRAPSPAPASVPQPAPAPLQNLRAVAEPAAEAALHSFEQLAAFVSAQRDPVTSLQLQRFVRPIEVKPGVFAFSLAEGAPPDLAQRLSAKLKAWTGRPWLMDIRTEADGVETGWERDRRERADDRAQAEADPFVRAMLDAFPGAEIADLRRLGPATTAPAPPSSVDEDEA